MARQARYILDTGIVIRHLRGMAAAVNLLRAIGRQERLAISSVTRLEIHAGMFEGERYKTHKLLSRFITVEMDADIADRAGDHIREARLRGVALSVPDAIIAATAMLHRLTLVTMSPKDFSISGLRLFPIASLEQE